MKPGCEQEFENPAIQPSPLDSWTCHRDKGHERYKLLLKIAYSHDGN
jgi:hypothetical protein